MKLLVRSPNWIGDQVLAYPFFHFLRQKYPSAKITVVCVPWVESLQFRHLVDEVVTLPKIQKTPGALGLYRSLRDLNEVAQELRVRFGPWDEAYVLPPSFSSAWITKQMQVPRRYGVPGEFRKFLLTERPAGKDYPHRADQYVALLGEGFLRTKRGSHFFGVPPVAALDEKEGEPGELSHFDFKREWILKKDDAMVESPREPYWVMAPGSVAASRRWDRSAFVEIARKIAANTGWRGVIIGGPAESVLADELCSYRELRLVDRTAQGSVAGLAELLAGAKFTISNDSGLAHVSAICGAPTFITWGAGNPQHTLPIGPGQVRAFFNPIECWPCEKNKCPRPLVEQNACLKGIHADFVWQEIEARLSQARESAERDSRIATSPESPR